ncbi:MAG: hypothetical protein NTW03_21685 [Verrucomicrobia bacterium]|nr:hypothetical protein [Verrucomicrobiota bacterium]
MNRRHFLKSALAGSVTGLLEISTLGAGPSATPPTARPITCGPKFHWRGYYDKLLFDPTNRFVLAHEVDFEGRSPRPEDVIRVGMVDVEDGDKWIELGATRAWNWQQGCMLQWVPGAKSEVIWNDREGDHFVCHVLDVRSGRRRTLPHPIYCLSPDGRWGLAPDFRRLNDTRPGYGYTGLPDPNFNALAPEQAGIWRMDMQTGKQELLLSFADAAHIPYPGGYSNQAKHWFNHLLFNTDGSRFLFLHRWRGDKEGKNFATRMFTANLEGKDLFILDPHGKTSHFIWRDPDHVMAWAWHPSQGECFYLYHDRTDQVEAVGKETMPVNGHNTYVPGTRNQWVLNDTYPDRQRLQHPYLYHIPTNRRVPLGAFLSPKEYQGEWRCDLHPCASRDGRKVVIDSTHGGNGRQVYLMDISGIVS